ncbi:MAG TPA: class I SAM-dependent methyltransferase [Bryobacteraceae bacterium]|nr:class I SAM-dependent methyltransferase [Bryobacteraceae bacterium]
MDVTNRFVLDFARQVASARPAAAILDFGCGAGELVSAGRANGLDLVGADVFYGGSQARADAERSGMLGTVICEIVDGQLPFEDRRFDLVTSNQVLEHVDDLDAVLREIHRVLKPGGTLLSLFPSRDVFREGHIGIPFAHWFRTGSRARYLYTCALRSAGLGTWKEQAPTRRQWARDKLDWLDRYTRYRPRREILAAFARHFANEFQEDAYIRYRLRDTPALAPLARLLDLPGGSGAATAIFRKLAFLVIVSTKEIR